MTGLQAVVLGVVQGLTEFLPVSSSGHLVIVQKLFGYSEAPVLFDIVLHVGTLLAIIIYFRNQFIRLIKRYFWMIVVGTIPAVVVGLSLNQVVDRLFNSLLVVGIGLLVTSLLLFLSNRKIKEEHKQNTLSLKRTFLVGVFQALAIVPGISRSGSTVVGGLLSGLTKKAAFSFSFILAIPSIVGALVLQIIDTEVVSSVDTKVMVAGFLAASLTGIFSLRALDKVVNEAKLYYFGYYCLVLGLVLIFGYL